MASPRRERSSAAAARRRAASLVLALVAVLASAACGGRVPRAVILISLDTLRADHLGVYGHERPTSPNLDALAEGGVVFEDAMATAPWTLPSHASLLTGLYPPRHGVETVADALPAATPTLASLLAVQGFVTGAIVNSVFLTDRFGLARGVGAGFRFLEPSAEGVGSAERITRAAIDWLGPRRGERVFLFLHYFDAHSDYRAPERIERLFLERRGPEEGTTARLLAINEGRIEPEAGEAERLARLYDAGIRHLDEELGRLLRWLDDEGWSRDTLVIVTSDHGEAFLEHGTVAHGRVQYQELLHVPLILRGPGVPRGVRVAGPVSLVDVAPTVLSLLGLTSPAGLDGTDLVPLWRSAGARERTLFATGAPRLGRPTLHAVRSGSLKLIADEATGRRELYDLESDPGERHDVAAERPARTRELASELDGFLGQARPGAASGLVPEDLRDALEALGYAE